jgi:hypothetical protein
MSPEDAPGPALAELQSVMRAALLGGDPAAVLAQVVADRVAPADRFACYANNVTAGLVEVLEAAFPATSRLAGGQNFRYAASRFAREQPPAEPRLLAYGAAFPTWLAGFGPAAAQPWLAEVARLEWARNEALFAADALPLKPEALAGIAPEAVPGLRFTPHPSLRLLRSVYPIHDLWLGERPAAELVAAGGPQDVLVLRPALQVIQLPVARGDAALLAALGVGAVLAEAAGAALAETADLDLQQTLFGHLVRGSFAAVQQSEH